jgi:hypothetical protein
VSGPAGERAEEQRVPRGAGCDFPVRR